MNKMISVAGALGLTVSAVAGEVFFEAKGPVTDKTEGFRFGNITFTDNDRVCAKFEQVDYDDKLPGRLTTRKLRLPHKVEGKGAYFKFSFDAQYTFTSGNGGRPQRCNQGVFFYDKRGRVLPDCYDTMYPGEGVMHYERVLYAWDEVDTFELFFQKPWAMKQKNGDACTLNVSNVRIETATWEDAARYCDTVYSHLPPLSFEPPSDCTALLPRTMEALETGRPWRVVLLGDSIMQDTFNSQFHALLKRAYPKSNVEWVLSMRGGTGCWHYCLADNFYSYVADHRPDLLIIGGVSNYKEKLLPCKDYLNGHEAMLRVAKLARERLGCEVLLLNGALAVDTRRKRGEASPGDDVPKMKWDASLNADEIKSPGAFAGLRDGARALGIPWWDMQTPCYEWLYESGLPYQYYSRDYVHSGELGKQIIGRIMLAYLRGGPLTALAARPPSSWFDEARYGVFIHFGAYAVGGRGEWMKNREQVPNDEYAAKYCRNFNPKNLDCADWARKFTKWGFKYAVLTSRHHDGYAMWDSKVNPFNCVKVGGAPDVVGEYVKAMRAAGLKVGLYYSPANWSHPDYPGSFFRDWPGEGDWKDEAARQRFIAYYRAEMKELLDTYGPIDYLWFDGCIPGNIDGAETLKWLRRDYPAMLVNNRLADGFDVKVCEQTINPPKDPTQRWEACMTLNDNWGFHAGDDHWKDAKDVIRILGTCAKGGGNLLLNVGPKPDGTIPEESCRILDEVGAWLESNRAAITSSERHPFSWNNTAAPITARGNKAYLYFINRPQSDFTWAELGNRCLGAKWLDDGSEVAFAQEGVRLHLKGLEWKYPCRVLELTLDGQPKAGVTQTTFWIPE